MTINTVLLLHWLVVQKMLPVTKSESKMQRSYYHAPLSIYGIKQTSNKQLKYRVFCVANQIFWSNYAIEFLSSFPLFFNKLNETFPDFFRLKTKKNEHYIQYTLHSHWQKLVAWAVLCRCLPPSSNELCTLFVFVCVFSFCR